MPYYPDKRNRYANAFPWDFAAGTGREGNRPTPEAKTEMAKRGDAPSEHFRVTTAPQTLEDLQEKHPQQPESSTKHDENTGIQPNRMQEILSSESSETNDSGTEIPNPSPIRPIGN